MNFYIVPLQDPYSEMHPAQAKWEKECMYVRVLGLLAVSVLDWLRLELQIPTRSWCLRDVRAFWSFFAQVFWPTLLLGLLSSEEEGWLPEISLLNEQTMGVAPCCAWFCSYLCLHLLLSVPAFVPFCTCSCSFLCLLLFLSACICSFLCMILFFFVPNFVTFCTCFCSFVCLHLFLCVPAFDPLCACFCSSLKGRSLQVFNWAVVEHFLCDCYIPEAYGVNLRHMWWW